MPFSIVALNIPTEKRKLLLEYLKDVPNIKLSFLSSIDEPFNYKPDLIILPSAQLLRVLDSKLNDKGISFIIWSGENIPETIRLIKENSLLQDNLKNIESLLDRKTLELKHKSRELTCLYRIAILRERPNITLEEIVQGIVDIIPSSMEAEDRICVRILLGYNEFKSKNFRFTPWKYISDVLINGEWGGRIELYYFQEPSLFIEKELIDAISERLGKIAERFRTEESLRLESRNIKNILDSAKDLIYKVNENYEIEYINPSLEKEFGPVNNKKCYEYFGKDNICSDCRLSEVLIGKTIRREWNFKKRIYDVLDTPIKNPDGTTSKLSILRDLTELKKAHIELREREELYRILTESVADGVILVENKRIIFANKAFLDMFKFHNPETVMNLNVENIFDPEFHPLCKKLFDPLFVSTKKEEVNQMNWLLGRTNKGDEIWVSVNANVITLRSKPIILATIQDVTDQVLWQKKVQEEAEYFRKETIKLRSTIKERYKFGEIIGKSEAMQKVYEMIIKAADSDASVVIFGESGTGKELVARAIHKLSPRADKPFVAVNCGAIPEQLAESEFFGHKKGAFTGAYADKHGYLYVANGGTLFLDEVGELDLNIQVKFLRAFETGEYSPIGDTKTYTSDFRLICATNKDLAQLVATGKMREDFYYRISVIPIYIPPLRERKEDIPLLVEHFLKLYGKGKHPSTLPARYMDMLMNYDWPGNVRELQGMIQRYLSTGNFEFLGNKNSNISDFPELNNIQGNGTLKKAVGEFEKRYILMALQQNRWHKGKVASILGIDPKTLYRKMKKYGISS